MQKLSNEDALSFVINYLRHPPKHSFGDYGYDLYVLYLLFHYFKIKDNKEHHAITQIEKNETSPIFMDACWDLCRRGILRPDTRTVSNQGSSQGAGYSITEFGKRWLSESNDDYVPTEPGRFAEMLEPYKTYFLPSFHQRAQEAVRCYGAHTYLACLILCGAASEAIIISVANALEIPFTRYSKIQEVVKKIADKLDKIKVEDINKYMDLLKYWRDEGIHGQIDKVTDNEAYTSLALLLRFAMFAKENLFPLHKTKGK